MTVDTSNNRILVVMTRRRAELVVNADVVGFLKIYKLYPSVVERY